MQGRLLPARVECRLGVMVGYYRAPKTSPYRWWPLFIGPVGGFGAFDNGYWRSWRQARGFEVSVFGCSVYWCARTKAGV